MVLTGPRQSGKTTVLRRLFGERYEYVSMEALDTRALAAEDPRAFLRLHKPPVILDEVQQAPHLVPYIQELIEERRELNGQFILSGSQNLLLLHQVSESMAGRAAILKLLPLSLREWCGEPRRPLPWQATPAAACPELLLGRTISGSCSFAVCTRASAPRLPPIGCAGSRATSRRIWSVMCAPCARSATS